MELNKYLRPKYIIVYATLLAIGRRKGQLIIDAVEELCINNPIPLFHHLILYPKDNTHKTPRDGMAIFLRSTYEQLPLVS